MSRLRTYLQGYVDGQFYAIELMSLAAANQLDTARKHFMCTMFSLPSSTAKALVHVFMLQRRWRFYDRAQSHDLESVRDAFLFDVTTLYPDPSSWTFQTVLMLKELSISVDQSGMDFPRRLKDLCDDLEDVEQVCFAHVKACREKTLSFFQTFRSVEVARDDLRSFLSRQAGETQDFLILFLSSGLRWRFFSYPSTAGQCPCCSVSFWSWDHFFRAWLFQMTQELMNSYHLWRDVIGTLFCQLFVLLYADGVSCTSTEISWQIRWRGLFHEFNDDVISTDACYQGLP